MNIFEMLSKERNKPVNILHGTDWWTDCDDITALRLLCRAHKAGAIELKCVCANAVMDKTASSISAFMKNEGVCVPIGLDRNFIDDGKRGKYQDVFSKYPHDVENENCDEAYRVYRRALANLDEKADITEVGFPQIIHQLMESGPDDISPESGMELIKKKVNKIWMMAGRWDIPNGREYNISAYPAAREAAHFIFENSSVPITLLGWETGNTVITGSHLPDGDMLKEGFEVQGSVNGRYSWDPMLVLLAIINNEENAGYDTVCGKAFADSATGINNFTPGSGKHIYVRKKYKDSYYADIIDELIK